MEIVPTNNKNKLKDMSGNIGLSSSKEDYVANKLKTENLSRVNYESATVCPKNGVYVKYVKRVLDFIIAFCALIVFLPINLILAVCTLLDVGRPIIFKQTRIGKNGKEFQIIKFRNMTNQTDEHGNLLPASQRVTKFGRFVRKFSLDELMNFWSVLKGDMSIIGPRPLPLFFEDRYSERHKMRNAVKPGLECPRMIRDENVPKYHEQFENDIWYVENVSFITDVKMVILLFKMTFDTKYRRIGSDGASYFVGYDDNNHATSLKRICKEHPYLDIEYENATLNKVS